MTSTPTPRQPGVKAWLGRETLRSAAFCLIMGLALTFVCEALSRLSPVKAALFIVSKPIEYLFNSLLIACCISFAPLFKRRTFAYAVAGGAWLLLGIINCAMRIFRLMPLNFYDFVVFVRNMDVTKNYMKPWEIIATGVGLAIAAFLFIVMFRRCAKRPVFRRGAALFIALFFALTAAIGVPYALANDDYGDPIKAYERYGFAYSLLRSTVDRGVTRPENYGQKAIGDILSDMGEQAPTPGPGAPDKPNIILLQLESFFDPANIAGVSCSENPIPHFSALREACSTGYLHVPMIGGGTANVEFEVVTGMNLADFGTGEYPYTTVLQFETCESVAFDLKKEGYAAHAIHNHTGTFYDRNKVLPMLGFDTFTSIEFMQDVEYNSNNWCRDKVLTGCVTDALTSTAGPDFIFCVSVQGHGLYAGDEPETPYALTATGYDDDYIQRNMFNYFINELRETDAFLGELLAELNNYPEHVVVAVYGDHLPALTMEEDRLRSGSLLATEYVLWSNRGELEKADRDLTSYQLAAYVMGRCSIEGGVISRFHQQCADQPDYLEQLQVIAYDTLYGDRLLYDGAASSPRAAMRMGVKDVTLSAAVWDGHVMTATGENFTPFSVLFAGDRAMETTFVNANTLTATPSLLQAIHPGDALRVCQVSQDGQTLASSNAVAWTGE